ncbi:MAG: dephospho-CoA kinase [Desulfosarcinaceae bacterium]|nr:dephospho-CoA kinase [Desulfosarcinaceae bacterium]
MVVGLTGGIASGKSTVAQQLRDLGADIIDADQLAREAVAPGGVAYDEVVEMFGTQIVAPDGCLDRQKLGTLVFADAQRRRQLEAVIHPYVRQVSQRRWTAIARRRPEALIIWDVPLLFESGMDRGLREIVVVYAPRAIQLERLIARDGLSEAAANARIAAQMDLDAKCRRATRVIDNSGSRRDTTRQVEQLFHDLTGALSG